MNSPAEAHNPDVRFWDKIADKYSRQPVADPNAFERKIAITLALMSPTDEVLDVGCGTGSFALRLAPYAAHVHGLDFSQEMLRIAREKVFAHGATNVSFHDGTLDGGAPFEPASLDGITAYSLLHLVKDRRVLLEQMHHLLKPGRFFVSSTVCLGDSRIPYGSLLSVMRAFGKAPTVRILSERTLIQEIQAAGFVDVQSADVGAKSDIAFIVAKKATE